MRIPDLYLCKYYKDPDQSANQHSLISTFFVHYLDCMPKLMSLKDNMSVWFIHPYTPLLYSKTGVYRGGGGIHYFLIFALKHRLWVLVRTASLRRF